MSENMLIPEQLKWHHELYSWGLLFLYGFGDALRYHWDADVQSIMDAKTPPAVVIFGIIAFVRVLFSTYAILGSDV